MRSACRRSSVESACSGCPAATLTANWKAAREIFQARFSAFVEFRDPFVAGFIATLLLDDFQRVCLWKSEDFEDKSVVFSLLAGLCGFRRCVPVFYKGIGRSGSG